MSEGLGPGEPADVVLIHAATPAEAVAVVPPRERLGSGYGSAITFVTP